MTLLTDIEDPWDSDEGEGRSAEGCRPPGSWTEYALREASEAIFEAYDEVFIAATLVGMGIHDRLGVEPTDTFFIELTRLVLDRADKQTSTPPRSTRGEGEPPEATEPGG